MFLIRKHKPPIQTPLFAIVFEESRGGVGDIYLINKKAFLRVVQENLSLFRVFLDKEISPQKLLQSVLEKGFLQSLSWKSCSLWNSFWTWSSKCFGF